MNDFCACVADVLEVDVVTPDTNFRDCPMWDSLCGFGLIVMISQNYARQISADDVMKSKTVADLARLAGVLDE